MSTRHLTPDTALEIRLGGKAFDVHLADLRFMRDALDQLLTILAGLDADLDTMSGRH